MSFIERIDGIDCQDVPLVDEAQWSILLEASEGDSRALLSELLELFEADVEERLHPLERACPSIDGAQIRHHAHSIAGSAANLAARRLAAIARWIELTSAQPPDEFAEAVVALREVYCVSLQALWQRVEAL